MGSVINEVGRTLGVAVVVPAVQWLLWITPDNTLHTHTINMANFMHALHPETMLSVGFLENIGFLENTSCFE